MGRRSKIPKVGEAANTYPQPFVSDPKLEDPDQTGIIGGSHGRDRSVYLAAFRRDWSASKPYYPLYKLFAASVSGESSSPPAAGKKKARRVAKLRTDVGGKTFVSIQSRWIAGVGGDPGGTIIYDTITDRVIHGPQLVAAKRCPVVAAVGFRIFALCSRPSYIDDPNFVPWFEVLDLKDAIIAEAEDGSLGLDGCSWKELPSPLCFPAKLTPMEYLRPPMITVRSYVVVAGRYIVVSLINPPSSSGTFAFDAEEDEWHKVDNENMPFLGPATPHGSIFLAVSRDNWPVSAYRISVVSASVSSSRSVVSAEAKVSHHKGGDLKLSVTVISVRGKDGGEVHAVAGRYLTSLDSERFSTLTFELDRRKRSRTFDETTGDFVPGKLFAKLMTYQIENPEILEEALNGEMKGRAVMPEVSISNQWEQIFKISSDIGFSTPHIIFAISI